MAHRTALITAGSLAIVVFAAAVAIGANLGILSVADSRPVGKLSASAAVQPAEVQVAAVPVVTPKAAPARDDAQKYIIRKAGSVSVSATKRGLRLVDVAAKRGWTWALAQSSGKRLLVTFKSHAHTYKFVAVLGRKHTIIARVDEPVTKVLPSNSAGGAVAWSSAPAPAAAAAPAPARGGESEGGGEGGAEADD
jgi:hypothetical protein